MKRTPPLLLALLGLGLLGGCSEDFDPYSRLKTLRVLAIKSDPPTPGPGETAMLSALTYVPDGETLSYEWSWCPAVGPANQGYPCLVTEAQLGMILGGASAPAYALGTGATASFMHSIPEAALASLCGGGAEVSERLGELSKFLDCQGGYGVQVRLVARSEKDGKRTDEVIAVRTLRLRFGEIGPNANPTLDGLWATDAKTPLDDANGAMVTLPRNKKTAIGAAVNEALAETYLGKDDNLRPAMVREKLIMSWFVETGDLKYERTSYIPGQVALDLATSNEWKPALPKKYAPGTARLIVVIRDDRGGVGWRSGTVALGGAP